MEQPRAEAATTGVTAHREMGEIAVAGKENGHGALIAEGDVRLARAGDRGRRVLPGRLDVAGDHAGARAVERHRITITREGPALQAAALDEAEAAIESDGARV